MFGITPARKMFYLNKDSDHTFPFKISQNYANISFFHLEKNTLSFLVLYLWQLFLHLLRPPLWAVVTSYAYFLIHLKPK